MRGKGTLKALCVLLAVVGLVALAPAAEACMECTCTTDEEAGTTVCICDSAIAVENDQDLDLFDPVVVSFPVAERERPERAVISVYGYQTTDIRNGFTCVVAMPDIPGVESVDAVTNLNTLTGEPLEHVTFAPISTAGEALGELAHEAGIGESASPWQAYLSNITGRVEDGIPNHFTIEVSLDGETTAEELVRNVQRLGGFFTASSDQFGFPNGGHTFLKRFADFDVMALYPPLTVEERPERGTRLSPVLP